MWLYCEAASDPGRFSCLESEVVWSYLGVLERPRILIQRKEAREEKCLFSLSEKGESSKRSKILRL